MTKIFNFKKWRRLLSMDVDILSLLLSGQTALLRSSPSLGKSCRFSVYTSPNHPFSLMFLFNVQNGILEKWKGYSSPLDNCMFSGYSLHNKMSSFEECSQNIEKEPLKNFPILKCLTKQFPQQDKYFYVLKKSNYLPEGLIPGVTQASQHP